MKRIITPFMVVAITIICLFSCNKETYAEFVVEGRIIDKITKEPVKDIMVDFHKYDIIHPPYNAEDVQKIQRKSPIGYAGWSNENGEFCTLERFSDKSNHLLLYVYGKYGNGGNVLYKDTTISVDFSNVPLSGKPSKNYKGDYVLNIGDIELEQE